MSNGNKENPIVAILKGGRGSGDFGHTGRAGVVGGSGGGGGKGRPRAGRRSREDLNEEISERKGKKKLSGKELDDDIKSNYSDSTEKPHDDNQLWEDYDNWSSGLSGDTKQAVIDYSGTDFSKDANNHLRGKGTDTELDDRIKDLDDALDSAPNLSENTMLYRASDINALSELKIGDKFTDKGFGSTTIDEVHADGWNEGEAEMIILAPKGAKGAYIAGISDWPGESEFLLPRNTKYEVLDIRGSKEGFVIGGRFEKRYFLQIIE